MDRKRLYNQIAITMLWLSALFTILILVILIGYIVVRGLPAFGPNPAAGVRFIFTSPRGITQAGGIFPTIIATIYVTVLSILIGTPIAVGAAIYLSEYTKESRITRIIRFGADALAGVPSIVLGLFGLSLFVYILGLGWSMLSAALTVTFMLLPILMGTTEEALKAVPQAWRQGSFGLGATKWQTVRRVVLPPAMPRILTGIVLGVGRVFGETAAVMFTAGLAINLPIFPTEPGRTMTNHLFLLATEGISMKTAYGTALLLMVIILLFNMGARKIFSRVR
ncbi:MAG: phosphate ABC transporter permease PstA [Actinomycetota bacterium]